jgi:phage-related tail fiber protein
MANETTNEATKYLSLEGLEVYDGLIKGDYVKKIGEATKDKVGKGDIQEENGNNAVVTIAVSKSETEGDNTIKLSVSHATQPKNGNGNVTYTKVTVDKYGHITEGANPTSLGDYGITDAYTTKEADEAINAKFNLIKEIEPAWIRTELFGLSE